MEAFVRRVLGTAAVCALLATLPQLAGAVVVTPANTREALVNPGMGFVFYRNAEGTVLVKLLFNGCEAKLGKLASDCWPYYRWDDARAYLKDKVREFSYPPEN